MVMVGKEEEDTLSKLSVCRKSNSSNSQIRGGELEGGVEEQEEAEDSDGAWFG